MKLPSKEDCVIGIMILSLAFNIYLLWDTHSTKIETEAYAASLIAERDSVINAQIYAIKVLAAQDRENANKDSIRAYNAESSLKGYYTKDSINKFQTAYAKKKVIHYNTTQRDSVYEYMYGAIK
jgi:hypothetical protein